MESWFYASEGKGLLFPDEIGFSNDACDRGRKPIIEWDGVSVDSMGFVDLGSPEMPKRPFIVNNTGLGLLDCSEFRTDSSKMAIDSPTCMIASNSSVESGQNHSISCIESSQDSSLIDLKLGQLSDGKDVCIDKFMKGRSMLSSAFPKAKRARAVSSRTQTPFCQVYCCNKDLSSSKDYHKRHKVCEAHSKTPVVVVNGIEQRFCQQCSRSTSFLLLLLLWFHLLAEFDDGRRSCRKRLAGHNERRRKPQFGTLSTKVHKLMHSYQGTKILGNSLLKKSPFHFPSMHPGGIPYPERYQQANRCRLSSSATEDYTSTAAGSTVNDLSGLWHSSCALSLLSAETQDLSNSLESMTSKMSQVSCDHPIFGYSNISLGIDTKEKCIRNGNFPFGIDTSEIHHMRSFMDSDISHATELQLEADEFLQRPKFSNAKYSISPEHVTTVDLLQLSSHLQRVEQQRRIIQVKHEHEDLCNFLTTYGI
ncbi:hypothetical protein K2173_016986 [Erythroxylum novogranatense]|uniref:SBP-type domain-containing protein n=1 Tax=Erythroxylum novogranatense TaxID=1862640 RepID=A0AAV8U9B8_9ROSI|nr:hypothetical protein K2173_016986 [Erythroxylum novogranatense]